MSVLGIEIGTGGCTAAAFSPDGQVLGYGYGAYPLLRPEPGALELDADAVLAAVCAAITSAAREVPRQHPVRALCISAQGEAVIPVDGHGRVLGPALTTFDSRPTEEAHWLAREVGRERIHRITGLPLHPMYALNKVVWWQRKRPDTARAVWKYLGFAELLLLRLGLDPVTDYSLGGRTMAMDMPARCWSPAMLDAAGLPVERWPALAQAGTVLGTLAVGVAREYALPDGIPVILGGHDQACAALGSGALDPGMAMDATGATEILAVTLSEPVMNPAMLNGHYGCYPHVIPGCSLTLAYNFTGGALLSWFRDVWGDREEEEALVSGLDVREVLLGKSGHDPSPILVLPHFTIAGTPWLDAQARGALVGLTLSTTREEVITGLFDGMAYEMRINLDALTHAGVAVRTVRAAGASRPSPGWLQRKANVYALPVDGVDVRLPACLGAALLAGTGAGIYADLSEAVGSAVHVSHHADPDPEMIERYAKRYHLYQQLYPALKPIFHAWNCPY